jgi:trans-aconitate methyltransferase
MPIRGLRLSLKPAKQLLWLFLWRDMRHSRGMESGIDAGCGRMENKHLFQTARYIGIDVDQDRLAEAKRQNPDAEIICAPIEEVRGVMGDMVLCVQVMHNRYFQVDNTVAAVRALIAMVRPQGVLIFNFGRPSSPYEDEVDGLLRLAFATVSKRKYGALSANSTVLAPILALAMFLLPALRKGRGYHKTYYVCRGRVGR